MGRMFFLLGVANTVGVQVPLRHHMQSESRFRQPNRDVPA
jgi:hypothetical protein